ncbi:MAG: DUF945 family protein [Psychrobium sp.]|nr:DUF945 family protein [Psychrobium sp.]
MKKILLPLSALLLIAGIAPKVISTQIESALNEAVVGINNTPGYKATLNNLNSGWFSTDANIDIALNLAAMSPQGKAMQEQLDLKVNIAFEAAHGPIIFGQHSGLGWAGWSATVQGDNLRDKAVWAKETPLYVLTSHMGIFGKQNFSDVLTPLSNIKDSEITFDFSGFNGKGSYSGDGLVYQGKASTINMNSTEGSVKITDATISMDYKATFEEMIEAGFYDSNAKFNIATMHINNPATSDSIKMRDLYMIIATALSNDKSKGNMSMLNGVKSIDVNDFHGDDLAMDIEFNNINVAVMKAWQAHSRSFGDIDPLKMQQQTMAFFTKELLNLLISEPQINITSLRATLTQGTFTSNMHTSLLGVDTLPNNLQDPVFWLSHMLMNGKVHGDKAVIEHLATQMMKQQMTGDTRGQNMTDDEINDMANKQTLGMLNMLVQQGMVSADETHYTSVLKLEDKKFTVNGKAIPLPFVMQ